MSTVISPSPTNALNTQKAPSIFNMLLLVFVLALIIVGAYYATKLIAKRGGVASRMGAGSARFNVLERLNIARDKSILLVQLYEAVYLVGVSNGSVSLLDKLTSAEAADMGIDLRAHEQREKKDGFATLGEFFKRTMGTKKTSEYNRPSFKNTMDGFGGYESDSREMSSDELDAMMLMMEKRRRRMNAMTSDDTEDDR